MAQNPAVALHVTQGKNQIPGQTLHSLGPLHLCHPLSPWAPPALTELLPPWCLCCSSNVQLRFQVGSSLGLLPAWAALLQDICLGASLLPFQIFAPTCYSVRLSLTSLLWFPPCQLSTLDSPSSGLLLFFLFYVSPSNTSYNWLIYLCLLFIVCLSLIKKNKFYKGRGFVYLVT